MKIISGGQTGADRAALDAALCARGVEVGGWIPRGRRSDDGTVPDSYSFLRETPNTSYRQRTEWNIRDADVTIVLHIGEKGPGTQATLGLCKTMRKQHLDLDIRQRDARTQLLYFLRESKARTINVAGPRESMSPGLYNRVYSLMSSVLYELNKDC